MQKTSPNPNDFRFARADFDALGWALIVSLGLHLLAYAGYHSAKKYHWLENLHLPAWLRHVEKALVVVPAQPLQPAPPTEPPLMFVEVNPAFAGAEPPKHVKYYSDKSSRAGNPHADVETTVPKITGSQEHVVKTEDVPRTKAFPLQPTPPPASKAVAQPEKPSSPTHPPGELLIAKREPKPHPKPTPDQTPRTKPRTIAEALARQTQMPGEKIRQDGGVSQFKVDSSLDVAATPFGAYDRKIIEAIQGRWYALIDAQRLTRGTGKVTIQFHLNYDGRVTDFVMLENTVGELLAVLCERAIRDPAPFAPWPSDMRRLVGANYREVKFTFYYN